MVIIKTNADTIDKVVLYAKHALTKRPRWSKGEIILIAQTKNTLPRHKAPIQYIMDFDSYYHDTKNESIELFGKYWPYIIVGRNCRRLKTPFDISQIKVSDKNYDQGGPIVYVEHADRDLLRDKGYLDTY